jgi:hypothetical protein
MVGGLKHRIQLCLADLLGLKCPNRLPQRHDLIKFHNELPPSLVEK